MSGFLGLELDTLESFNAIILLVVTSGFINTVAQYLKLNVCQDARLLQAGLLFILGLLFGSSFAIVLSIIEMIIGIADFVAVTSPSFAWLDPNLA